MVSANRVHLESHSSTFRERGGSNIKLYWQLVAVTAEGLGSLRAGWELRYGIRSKQKTLQATLPETPKQLWEPLTFN